MAEYYSTVCLDHIANGKSLFPNTCWTFNKGASAFARTRRKDINIMPGALPFIFFRSLGDGSRLFGGIQNKKKNQQAEKNPSHWTCALRRQDLLPGHHQWALPHRFCLCGGLSFLSPHPIVPCSCLLTKAISEPSSLLLGAPQHGSWTQKTHWAPRWWTLEGSMVQGLPCEMVQKSLYSKHTIGPMGRSTHLVDGNLFCPLWETTAMSMMASGEIWQVIHRVGVGENFWNLSSVSEMRMAL